MNWIQDKKWSDLFMPEIKAILGFYLLGEATNDDDCFKATDLMLLKMDSVRIAVRMRKKNYSTIPYINEFTIRTSRTSGAKTELTKIISGWGDYLFYGFENTNNLSLGFWNLIDLKIFRENFARMQYLSDKNILPGNNIENWDGSSSFTVFKVSDFPPSLIKAQGVGLSFLSNKVFAN
jgi:hypothetical protein